MDITEGYRLQRTVMKKMQINTAYMFVSYLKMLDYHVFTDWWFKVQQEGYICVC